jgi:hypothetical protein
MSFAYPLPRIFYARVSDFTYSASATNPTYPLTNLNTYYETDYWQCSSVANNNWLAIDFGSAVSCNSVVVGNMVLNGLMTTIALQAADDSGFSVNLVTPVANILAPPAGTGLTGIGGGLLATAVSFSAVSKRYWRLLFSVTNGNYPTVGNFWVGTELDCPYTYSWPYQGNDPANKTSAVATLSGAYRKSQTNYGRRKWKLDFKLMPDSFKTAFQTFVQKTRGSLYPFYFADVDGASLYYVYGQDFSPVQVERLQLNNVTGFTLEEQQALLY